MIGCWRSADGECALLSCRAGRTGAHRRAALRTTNIERTVRRLLVVNLQTRRTLWTNNNHGYSIMPSIEPESENALGGIPSRRTKSSAAVMPFSDSSRLFWLVANARPSSRDTIFD